MTCSVNELKIVRPGVSGYLRVPELRVQEKYQGKNILVLRIAHCGFEIRYTRYAIRRCVTSAHRQALKSQHGARGAVRTSCIQLGGSVCPLYTYCS